jgi:hypothetical protein
MLVPLLAGSSEVGEAIDILLNTLSAETGSPITGRRLLQALVSLGYRGTEGFWMNKFDAFGDEVIPVVFFGLLHIDISRALLWVDSIQDPERKIETIYAQLPGMIEDVGSMVVLKAFRTVHQQLNRETANVLLSLFEEEGIQLPSIPETTSEWEVVIETWLTNGIPEFYSQPLREDFLWEMVIVPNFEMRQAIRTVFFRWNPFGGDAIERSLRMILLIRRYHSAETVAVLIGAMHQLLGQGAKMPQHQRELASEIFELLGQHSGTFGALEEPPFQSAIWDRYLICVRIALQIEPLALTALRQVVLHLPDELNRSLVNVLHHRSVDVAICRETLGTFFSPEDVNSIFRSAIIQYSKQDHTHIGVNAKFLVYVEGLSSYDPELNEAEFVLRDASIPGSAQVWVERIVGVSAGGE